MEKFELGPIQKSWVESLRKHPERQRRNKLGEGEPDNYKACCLGEALLCYHRAIGTDLTTLFNGEVLFDVNTFETNYLSESYKLIGLRDNKGNLTFGNPISKDEILYYSLASANDGGITWPEIADFIEQNPEVVFTKSV